MQFYAILRLAKMQTTCQRTIGDRGIFVLSGSEFRAMIKKV
jgi:hypothetical protein